MTHRVFLLPLWLRLWHWANALLILILAITGYSLHFADPTWSLPPFALAARIHDVVGVALAALYSFFVIANIVTGNGRHYVPKPPGVLRRCWVQTRYYGWGIFKGEPHPYPPTPEVNFNALQAIVYWGVMYLLMPVIIFTGLIFLFPQSAPDRLFGVDGLAPIALLHYVAASILCLFALAHIYLGSTGVTPTSLYKMMITGWHEH